MRKKILDEECYCGHYRSVHHDTIAIGHGKCAMAGCKCRKFTWAKFIYKHNASTYADLHSVAKSR